MAAQVNKLPKKEAEQFRLLVDCYEKKNFKKGIKTADAILKKFPNSGETQAMKGIILNSMGKKIEAYELVKLGLKNDVRSHICWHVYGLMHRSDSNYKEAIKCYLNALRIDPGNQNILRDLSWLQIQMRDFPGFFTSRRKLLESKSTSRASWVAFAVANFFVRDFNAGFDVVNKYIENVSEKGDQYEESELLLFQNTCLVKLNKHAEALEHLEKNKHQIVDKLSWTVKRAELLALSGHFDVAIEEWETLVRQQPENYHFHRGLQASVLHMPSNICEVVFNLHGLSLPCNVFALSREKKQILREWYNQNAIRSRSIEKIMLFLCIGEEQFAGELRKYMLKCLNNGVPSLNHDICSLALIADPSHSDTLVNITDATQFIDHPVITVALNTVDSLIADGRSELSPVGFLWSLYLKAHLMEIIGSYLPALNAIEEAIVHTPTAIDMHAKKARILKKMGRLVDAAITMDDCRALDLQDRYLNNKATKYFLRADQVEVAMNTIAMFTKHEGDPQKTLFDLQCSWYELESAESYARQKKWGLALKKFNAIRTHFIEQYDDLFDFHGYCIRKTTLRAYLNIMDVQDKSFAHKNFQRAIKGALSIYLHLLDYPEDIDGLGHLSPAERKRERAKLKKKRQQKEDHPVEEETKQADHDPDGEQLLQKDFLIESGSWCNYLQNRIQLCDGDTLSLLAEIMVRRGKHIQAFRSLKFALSRYPNSPSVVVCFVKYALKWRNKKFTGVNPIVATVLKSELISILNSESLGAIADYVENFVQFSLHSKCLKTILGGIKCLHYLDRNNHSRMGELLTSIMEEPRCFTCINEIVETIKFFEMHYEKEEFWKSFANTAAMYFTSADFFTGKTYATERTKKDSKESIICDAP